MKRILLLSTVFFYALTRGYGQAGNLDSSFGTNGVVKTDAGVPYSSPGWLVKVLLAKDGSFFNIIVPEGQSEIVQISKRHPDGSIDQTYGKEGFSDVALINASDAVMQPDGKIVVAGYKDNVYTDFEVARYNADGSLDKTFGSGGYQYTDMGAASVAQSLVLQNDGKIVLGGTYRYMDLFGEFAFTDFALTRYNSDGSPDQSFGHDGKQLTGFFDSSQGTINSLVLQKDGRIVAAGYTWNGSSTVFALARYNPDGSLDKSFSHDGKQTTSFGGNDYAYNAAIQHNGKIIVTGFDNPDTKNVPVLARYNTDGSPDSTFDGDGKEITGYSVSISSSQKIAIQTDDKIVMINNILNGENKEDFAVARFNANGGPDHTFSADGKLTTDFNHANDAANTLVIQKDGKIVVAGSVLNGNVYYFGVVKYNNGGTTYKSFGVAGKFQDKVGQGLTTYLSTAIQKNGKVVAAGVTWGGAGFEFVLARYTIQGNVDATFAGGIKTTSFGNGGIGSVAIQDDGKTVVTTSATVARYNTDGSSDSTFGNGGKKTIDFGGQTSASTSLAIQKDGKIIVGGNSDGSFAIARYNTDGSADNTFNGNGKEIIPMGFADALKAVVLQSDGKILMAGSTYNGGNFDSDYFAITRLNINGTIDKSFGTNGKKTGSFGYKYGYINSVAMQSDGKIIVAGNINDPQPPTGFALARFTKNGTLDPTFGKTGLVFPDNDVVSHANSVVIQDNGKILIGGDCNSHSAITRINTNGTPDSSFGDNGRKIVPISIQSDVIYSIAIEANTVYAVGTAQAFGSVGTVLKFLLNQNSIPPAVSLTAPLNNAVYHAPATIKLNAIASDKDGTITKVEFYNGITLLHTETLPAYNFNWQNVPGGHYTLTARATDNTGNTTVSAPVTITVTPPGALLADRSSSGDKTTADEVLSLHILPNPATNILNINTTGLQQNQQSTISIISASGVIMQTIQTNAVSSPLRGRGLIQLNVSTLARGTYIIKMVNGDKVIYKPFIKM